MSSLVVNLRPSGPNTQKDTPNDPASGLKLPPGST
jgi:hypothetical protein